MQRQRLCQYTAAGRRTSSAPPAPCFSKYASSSSRVAVGGSPDMVGWLGPGVRDPVHGGAPYSLEAKPPRSFLKCSPGGLKLCRICKTGSYSSGD
eukprot:COSAG01_NODE_2000_length_8686_cov_3.000116_8_plen_95_part_00